MKLKVVFLPGLPNQFEKQFKIQVAHFEPETITVFCEGTFPRVSLDLPRYQDPSGVFQFKRYNSNNAVKRVRNVP